MRLDLSYLKSAYQNGQSPVQILTEVYDQIESKPLRPVWISLVPRETALARAAEVEKIGMENLPLYGIPFAVKDNIDVAGMATTAGCHAFAYTPAESATVVKKLEAAGAILVGKTNMDQFATGLVGTRSPYGACSSVFDENYISGGSSSGSAVAVASGLVSFSLGTDTAGSGRVPAAFNNIVGLKPTPGTISTRGVVPACRTLDCVSIFALTCGDALDVFQVARGFDLDDPNSKKTSSVDRASPFVGGPWLRGGFNLGIIDPEQEQFFGDYQAKDAYAHALSALTSEKISFVDLTPFRQIADLLYSGPWVAERLAALKDFFDLHADEIDPIVRQIVTGAERFSAVDLFNAQYRLEELRREAHKIWDEIDVLMLPTTGTTYTHAQIADDPVTLNTNLGYYTNFANLLNLAAVAVPAGFRGKSLPEELSFLERAQRYRDKMREDGLPFGITLFAPAGSECALLDIADSFHRKYDINLGGLETKLIDTAPIQPLHVPPGCVLLAVVGAHLMGQPLNRQLTERGARLVITTETALDYRLYALQNTTPPKPGLVREPGFAGPGIELEVWAMPTEKFGSFVAEIPAPLGIGSVTLADGTVVKGFICEPSAIHGSTEITEFGGWRAYLKSKS